MAIDKGMGGFSQPGARSTRQETPETEVKMPLLQAVVRGGVDMVAALLVMAALAVGGRWAIWATICLVLCSEYYDATVDWVYARLSGGAADVVDWGSRVVKWVWPVVGYPLLRVFFPITWTMERMVWQRSVVGWQWPFVYPLASPWSIAMRPEARVVLLVVLIAPLFTWQILRNRMKWSLWEFTPYGPVNVAEQGINPQRWGPREQVQRERRGGFVVQTTDFQPHTEQVAQGVFRSNGRGSSFKLTDFDWVTDEQWEMVGRLLVEQGMPFTEPVLGRGRVFPTHGPFDEAYGEKLGYRFFRRQMFEAGYVKTRDGSQNVETNAGLELTPGGIEFLKRNFLDGG